MTGKGGMQQTLAEGGIEPLTASKDSAFHG